MTRFRSHSLKPLFVALCALAALLLAYPATTAAIGASPFVKSPVDAAWQRAQDSGVFSFATTIVETTYPAPTVANVGRTSREKRTYIEGESNMAESTLLLTVWQNGGNVIKTRDGIELRVEGDQAYGREIGGSWHELETGAATFAPGNDTTAYLVGARNVHEVGTERRTLPGVGDSERIVRVTRYAFDLNGPEVAGYIREQLEDQLRERGELPAGMHLDTPDAFRSAIGEGEVCIDGDGLPLRLKVHVEYPQQQDGERVEIEIQTDFSGFDRQRLVASASLLARVTRALGIPDKPEQRQRLRHQAALALGTLSVLGFVVVNRRSKAVYAALVVAIIGAMVVTPVLRGQQAHAFSQRLAERQAEQERREAEQRRMEDAVARVYGSDWDPHRSAEERALTAQPVLGLSNGPAADQMSVVPTLGLPLHSSNQVLESLVWNRAAIASENDQPDPDSDDDGDGLTFAQEMRLGTDPDEKDTDGDQITDDVEVAGFRYSGKMWYLNPRDPDTNNDGEVDSVECPEQVREDEDGLSPQGQVCQNTDSAKEPPGEKVPDAFDRDNDGDGVPDRMDLSPYSAMDAGSGHAFDGDAPLLLQVDDLEADKPVFVDFQIRPEDEDHLWYALNVLDWPSGDERAQIQRQAGNDSTWESVAGEGDVIPVNSGNGDMRLIPLLEIEIPFKEGHYGNLPVKEGAPVTRTDELTLGQWLDTSKLVPYGISVRELNEDGDLAAYVPLNLVEDETGGDRTAFAARMHYWPTITTPNSSTGAQTADWGLTQKVRMMWLVHMLTDRRNDKGEWVTDVPLLVRVYPEEWRLTGLSVKEDHGLEAAITYEDPGSDNELQYDDPLWMVALGLENSFIAGRDQDEDGELDVTIAEIDSRFSLTSTATITARFGISLGVKLETETYSYAHGDYAAHIMMTETHRILSPTFAAHVTAGADAVTLLLSQENYARTANLDAEDETITISGNELTVDLDPDAVPLVTSTHINWGPFRFKDDKWQSYPIADYISTLEVRLKDVFNEYRDDPDFEQIQRGQLTLAKAYYLAIYGGLHGQVMWGTELPKAIGPVLTDSDLADRLSGDWIPQGGGWIADYGGTLAITIFNTGDLFYGLKESWLEYVEEKEDLGKMYNTIGEWVDHKLDKLAGWKMAGFAMKVTKAVVLAATAICLFASLFLPESDVIDVILRTTYVIGKVAGVLGTIFGVVAGGGIKASWKEGIKDLKKGEGVKASIIFVVMYLAVTWGVFFYQLGMSGAKAGSLAANAAFASMAAAALTVIILEAISFIPIIGPLLTTLIWLIDAIAMWACEAQESDNWFCEQGGIEELITKGITWWLYGAHIMVTVSDTERLDIEEMEQEFLDPDLGLTVGNSLVVSTTVKNSLDLLRWQDTDDWKVTYYAWQYSDRNLASSTFKYRLAPGSRDIHNDLERFDIFNRWKTSDGRPFSYKARNNTETGLDEAGINRNIALYLSEGFAIPVQECWAILGIPVCYVRTEKDSNRINLGKGMFYDIFPATFSDFYNLAEKDDGYALAWSLDSDPPFPRLKDADGDGLRNRADGGADPDDHNWDTDGDRLSDFLELQKGTDPRDPDSDEDGLTDREEIILGTDPLRTDTDYDGLDDQEEVDGWEFVYDFAEDGSPVRAWVTSDPLSMDLDRDEVTDFQEKTFGFNPRVASDPRVLTFDSQVREEDAPVLLLRLNEMEDASTFRDDSGYANNGTCEGGNCPASGHLGKDRNAAHFGGADDTIAVDGVSPYVAGGPVSFGGWVSPDGGATTDGALFAFNTAAGGDVHYLGFDPTDNHFFFVDTGARIETDAFATGTWHHVFVAIDEGGDGTLYVNGDPKLTFTTGDSPTEDGQFSIGQEFDGGTSSDFFLGLIDEVLVFNRELEEAEVEEVAAGHYNTADYVVRPGDPLHYRASVSNELFNRYAQGLLTVDFPPATSEIPPEDFILNPQEELVLTGTLNVASGAATGVYSLTQEVDAMITDWRETSDYAELLWHFTEDTPPFADSSGSQPEREGGCSGGACPTSTTGRKGNGLDLDGIDDYVANENVSGYLIGDVLSFGAWVSPTNGAAVGTILAFNSEGGGDRNGVFYDPATNEFFYRDKETPRVDSGRTFTPDRWYHVMVVIYEDDQEKQHGYLYVNGDREASFATAVRPDADGTFNVGQEWDGGTTSDHFDGLIDEVAVFNRALSEEEVKAYYSAPVFDLPLDEAAGAVSFEDESGFENHAVCDAGDGRCPRAGEGGLTSDSDAIRLDGNDYLAVAGSPELDLSDSDFTLSAWVYPTGGPANSDCAFWAEYKNKDEYDGVTIWPTVLSRCEEWPVDYDWGASSPDPGNVNDDEFLVTWEGDFHFEEGDYHFDSTHDDRITVRLDGTTILQNYSPGTDRATVHVTAGRHRVQVYYQEFSGSAHVDFAWSPAPAFYPQGVLGVEGGAPEETYPTIQRVANNEARISFVTPTSDTIELVTDGDVLRSYRWNHLVATYDGQFYELYVNGQEVGEVLADAGDTPASNTSFEIGRTGNHASFRLKRLEVIEESDPIECTMWCGDHAGEYLIQYREDAGAWEQVWVEEALTTKQEAQPQAWCLDYEADIGVSRSFTDYAEIRVFEDDEVLETCHYSSDGNDTCNGACTGVSDLMGVYRFETDDPAAGDFIHHFRLEGGWPNEVAVTWDYTNTAPFRGKIDQVSIYRKAFDADEVIDLYDAGTTVLHLPLDDPPGSTEFEDALGQAEGTCTGDTCPTVGVPGRDNFALRFDGDNDYVEINEANTDDLQELTVAAWVKPLSMPSGEIMRFITVGDEKAVLRYDDNFTPGAEQLHFYMSIGGSLRSLRVDHALTEGVWHHVAGTCDGAAMRLYLDGSLAISQTVTGTVGGGDAVLLSSDTESLHGLLDDVIIYRRTLGSAEIEQLYRSAPQMLLTLDEPEGNTFEDETGNGHHGACSPASRCPDAGVKGQLGLAAGFDGEDDTIQVPHHDDLNPGDEMTLVAWVRLTDAEADQKIVGKTNAAQTRGYVLGIEDGQLCPEVWTSSGAHHSAKWGRISPDFWTFVAVTYESGGDMVGYINGEVVSRTMVSGSPIGANSDPLRIGVAPWNATSFPANGRIDHVTLYGRALTAREMRALFRLQAKWVEERQSIRITVDADVPSSVLESDAGYRPNQDVLLLVSAHDDTSRVTKVELGVSVDGGTTYSWESAPRCQDTGASSGSSGGDAAWCPTFSPSIGEGRYLLQTRATDSLGHQESPVETTVFLVDDTPPDLTTGVSGGDLIQATSTSTETWLVPLAGIVSDPDIQGTTEDGSGVEGVSVRLIATSHTTDTMTPRVAVLDGGDWEIDFPLPYADVTGWYTFAAQSVDGVGNVGPFVDLARIGLDTSPPQASLDEIPTTITDTITTTLTLSGLVTETGVVSAGISYVEIGFLPAELTYVPTYTVAMYRFDEPSGATSFADVSNSGIEATCPPGSCPTAGHAGAVNQSVLFDGGDALIVTQGEGFADLLPERDLSVVAWVKPFGYTAPEAYVSAIQDNGGFEKGWALGQRDTGLRRFFFALSSEGADDGDGVLTYLETPDLGPHPGRWYHVAATYDGTTMRLYVDGELEVENATSQSGAINYPDSGWFAIGSLKDDNQSDGTDGYLDEVAVFNQVLTPSQIRALSGAGGRGAGEGGAGENVVPWDDTVLGASGDGVINTTWSYDLGEVFDGVYQINLRPADVFDNVAAEPDRDSGWDGEIDTRGPRVEATAEEQTTNLGIRTTYRCWAQDFNLVWMSAEHPEYNFECPCQDVAPHATVYTPTYYHQASMWYGDVFSDSSRLYALEASCTVFGPAVAPDATVRACDVHGHCSSQSSEPSQFEVLRLIDSAVMTPTQDSIVTSTAAISVTGRAYANQALKAVTVTVDGAPIGSHTWTCSEVNDAEWASTWAAPTEGIHTLSSHAVDCNDEHQPVDRPVEVTVDSLPPTISIAPTLLTTTHRLSQGRVVLTGAVSDTNGIRSVVVSIDGGDWENGSHHDEGWQYDWYLGEEPAGEQYTVTARATDVGGHTARVTETVTVNLQRPNPITLTLSMGGQVITPGATITWPVPATLDLSWITSTERTDLEYDVTWTVFTTETNRYHYPVLPIPFTGPFSSTWIAGEAERIVPSVKTRLDDGNSQVDSYGSVYVDSRLTPDYIALDTAWGDDAPYLGWMDSGCSRLGVDRRARRNAPGSAAIDELLQLYVSWDSEALRLVWTGANWDYAGDLFIYLDTMVGGALKAMNPFTETQGTVLVLPGDTGTADFLIWVEDSETAHLLSWDGISEDWDSARLSPDQFRFDEGLNGGHTDLYLPFGLLGIAHPETTPLALVAFATEEDKMALWGTMPPQNPVNSDRVLEMLDFAPDDVSFGLTQFYFWPALAPGVCPNSAYGDKDVEVSLTADPVGATYGFLGSDLFWLWDRLITDTHTADVSELFTFMDVDHPPTGDGETISYTLEFINRGTMTATGVYVHATALYALRFGGSFTKEIALGDIGPGEQGRATFQGQVDTTTSYNLCLAIPFMPPELCEPFRDWAAVQVVVLDTAHGMVNPLDWLWADHRVDSEPPEFFDFQQPERFINPGDNTFQGYAYDASGVPTLTLGVQAPPGTTVCQDGTPFDGAWSCDWNAGGAADGTELSLRLQAADRYGQASVWTGWRGFIVDAVPPTVTFSAETTETYSGTVVNADTLSFRGDISDGRAVGEVMVCLEDANGEEECGSASVQATGDVSMTRVYTDVLSAPITTTTFCGGGELVRTFVANDDYVLGEVQLGINADHVHRNDISATLTSPTGTSVQVLGSKEGTPGGYQNYDVLLFDAATADLHDFRGDDDTGEPFFDRPSRPLDPMRVFRGEGSAGTWTLTLCDTDPITHHGVYSHSQLVLKPLNTASREGSWSYTQARVQELDAITHTLSAYGMDSAGNESRIISLTFVIDNVAPSVEVTETVQMTVTTSERPRVEVLAGHARDGGRIVQMYAFVESPHGNLSSQQVGRGDGDDTWWFDLEPDETGHYNIWINAVDVGENTGRVGAYDVNIKAGPIADAGVDQFVDAGTLVTLDGGASYDPDGDPLTYWWEQGGGPAVTLSDASAISPTFTAPWVSGPMTFTLTVTDTDALTDTDEVVVTPQYADLIMEKEVSANTPRSGDTIVYTLTVTNAGPDDVVGLVISDMLPSGVTHVAHDSGAYEPESGEWSVGVLGGGDVARLHITVTVDAVTQSTLITNTAVISEAGPIDPTMGDRGSHAATAAQHPGAVIVTVTPEGGGTLIYVNNQGYTTTVEIPAGAVSETITIILTPLDGPSHPTAPWEFAGHAFTLEAYRGPYLLPGYVFLLPVAVTIHYSDEDIAEIADEAELLIRTWAGGGWVDAACDGYLRNLEENWLSTEICHLSEFALLGEGRLVGVGGETLAMAPLGAQGCRQVLLVAAMVLLLTMAAAVVRRRD